MAGTFNTRAAINHLSGQIQSLINSVKKQDKFDGELGVCRFYFNTEDYHYKGYCIVGLAEKGVENPRGSSMRWYAFYGKLDNMVNTVVIPSAEKARKLGEEKINKKGYTQNVSVGAKLVEMFSVKIVGAERAKLEKECAALVDALIGGI